MDNQSDYAQAKRAMYGCIFVCIGIAAMLIAMSAYGLARLIGG